MEKQKYIGGVNFEELRAQRIQLYNTLTLDLGTARNNEELPHTGNYLYVLEATDILANVQIRFNEISMNSVTVTKGRGVRVPFYRLYITNAAQAGKSITLGIAVESATFEIIDIGKALEISGSIDINGAGGAGSYDDVNVGSGASERIAANPSRRQIHLLNAGATGQVIYLGFDSSLNTGNGFPLYPMVDTPELARLTLVTQMAIYGLVASGYASLRYFEENNP